MASTSAKRAAKRNKREEEPAGGVSRVAGTSKAATVQKKQTFSVKEAKRMLEESDIDDLHCEELDSSTQSSDDGDNVNDTQTESDEPPTQASKRPKMSKKNEMRSSSPCLYFRKHTFPFAVIYLSPMRNPGLRIWVTLIAHQQHWIYSHCFGQTMFGIRSQT